LDDIRLDIAVSAAKQSHLPRTRSPRTPAGTRGFRQIALDEATGVLRGSAGWRSASGDTSAQGLHAFSTGDAFTVAGAPTAQDAAVIGTGVDVLSNANTTSGLTYTGQLSDTA